mmetsp:Transcript_37412/g.55987  ORF Transcript_37412/g.55987 Transcript_37412/m.55987 type:complete len:140 (+) Transcript_37412:248-667(+)
MASVAALRTLSFSLVQAANVGLVPAKWGGVFGQEMKLQECEINTTDGAGKLLNVNVEEWKPTRQGDVLQDVRKATNILRERIQSPQAKKLPVTLLSGFLGLGKTHSKLETITRVFNTHDINCTTLYTHYIYTSHCIPYI